MLDLLLRRKAHSDMTTVLTHEPTSWKYAGHGLVSNWDSLCMVSLASLANLLSCSGVVWALGGGSPMVARVSRAAGDEELVMQPMRFRLKLALRWPDSN